MYALTYHDEERGHYRYIVYDLTYEQAYATAWLWSIYTGRTTQIIFTGWPCGWDHYEEI